MTMPRTRIASLFLVAFSGLTALMVAQNPFDRTDVTQNALIMNGAVPVTDTDETDFCAVDIDLDGDMDCLVGRKLPFSTVGPRTNILLINNGTGILVDETATYTTFNNDADNTRDIISADFDNDGWPDIMVGNSEGDPTRLYLNRGNDVGGNWLGLDAPQNIMFSTGNHKFCAINYLDQNLDGMLDLYRGDYNSTHETTYCFRTRRRRRVGSTARTSFRMATRSPASRRPSTLGCPTAVSWT